MYQFLPYTQAMLQELNCNIIQPPATTKMPLLYASSKTNKFGQYLKKETAETIWLKEINVNSSILSYVLSWSH